MDASNRVCLFINNEGLGKQYAQCGARGVQKVMKALEMAEIVQWLTKVVVMQV